MEDYLAQADEEEKYIQNEKNKFEGTDSANETEMSLEKLRIVQIIDRENRAKKTQWNDEDSVEEDQDSDDDRGFTADDMGDEENPRTNLPKNAAGPTGKRGDG